jgi:hypothetical protein
MKSIEINVAVSEYIVLVKKIKIEKLGKVYRRE